MMAATSWQAPVMSSLSSVCSSGQVASIVTLLFLFGSAQVKVADGVNQCIKCESSSDIIHKGISCEKKPPLPEPCPNSGSSVYCMKNADYDENGVVIRFARGCTTVNAESGCKHNSPEDVKQGMPAKSCIYRCDSDGCNTGNGIHYRVDVLLVSGLLTTMLSVFVRV